MNEEIIVYDDYKINLYKYPRTNSTKEKTDIIIIIFLMHEDFLKKLAYSYDNALTYYNQCKEYYYIYNFNKIIKKYSAIEIILLMKKCNELYPNIDLMNSIDHIDIIYYFYIKNRDFYLNLYKSMEHAKKSYFERREYNYRIIPSADFYSKIGSQTYSAIELMELNAYTHYLIQKSEKNIESNRIVWYCIAI